MSGLPAASNRLRLLLLGTRLTPFALNNLTLISLQLVQSFLRTELCSLRINQCFFLGLLRLGFLMSSANAFF